jgi:hypothetical protein
MTKDELSAAVDLHGKWVRDEPGGVRFVASGANLYGANLRGANLRGADLRGADLYGADLYGADLYGANLRGANLRGADLRGADLCGANLRGADLYGTDLYGADLRGADLCGANLRGADLYGTDLYGANLRHIRTDLWDILLKNKHEARGVLVALRDGRVDGSTYQGDCACLVGTIAKVRGRDVHLPEFEKDSSRPAEVWFMSIKKGDTPETNQISAITVDWVEEFLRLLEAA